MLDLADHVIAVLASDGAKRTIDFVPARPIAEIWAEYSRALRDLEIVAPLWDKPQERSDATPFSEDSRPRDYDPALGAAWFGLLTRLHAEFDVWRSPFFGRTGVGFWWGGFDLSAVLFSGRHAVPRAGADYIMRYDLDAEQLVVGFWPGNDDREAQFFAYLVPEPPGCDKYPLEESAAGWAPALGEWILPYDAVRTAAEPHRVLRAFMGAMYQAAGTLGGWDLDQFTYARPPGYRATSASVDTVDSPTEDVSRRPSSGTGGSDEHDSAE